MLVSKLLVRRPAVTSTWKGADTFLRTLSAKNPIDPNADVLKSNPYFGKYADKIKEMKKSCPEELNKRLVSLLEKTKVKATEPQQIQTKVKKLEDIMYIDLIQGKSASDVKTIWENFHHGEHKFATSVPLKVFKKLQEQGASFPTFLFPLPRARGFEYILSQFSGSEIHFSPLINYQMFKENAPECLAVTHFTEMADATELVLVLGEFNSDVLDATESLCLYHQLQRYYGEDDPRRLRLIEQFTHSPLSFLHMDLIAELEALR